ncbi:MAG TPA: gliding motility-associated C-terminal domain-containing protein [Puia sp.]|nr:gliding motility-associated C-terminal domain-containing protein [Puia sp.]
MNKNLVLPIIFLTLRIAATAQCGFPAALSASPNGCLGATLHVTSPHAIKYITWYQDGKPVSTATAAFTPGALVTRIENARFPGGDTIVVPMGFVVDNSGGMYATTQNQSVIKWSEATNSWLTVAGGNGMGTALNQLSGPQGLVIDKAGNLYISDDDDRVLKWTPGAASGTIVAGGNGHGRGSDQFRFNNAGAIALDCDGNLYVCDNGNARVQRWAPGATSGVTVAGGNGIGVGLDQLAYPNSIAVDGEKNVFVLDGLNNRIVKWAPGATSGVVIGDEKTLNAGSATVGSSLYSFGSIFVDNYDTLYLSEVSDTSRIIKLAPGAARGTEIASARTVGPNFFPFTAYVDGKGTIYGAEADIQRDILGITRPTAIDNSYKPAAGGRYYAVVTDVLGYSTTTDTLTISPPPPGPPSIQITAQTANLFLCESDLFTATTTNAGLAPSYQWQVSGVDVGGDSLIWSNDLFGNGDKVYCIMTTVGTSCETIRDTSNAVTLSVDPQGHATVTIDASDSSTCAGTPITLTATVINGSASPALDWYVDGQSTGIGTPTFTDSTLGSKVIYCVISSDASCGLAKSNTIPIVIDTLPTIQPGQTFTIPYGKSLTLEPVVSGNITSYLWTPGAGLSDSTIIDPTANPLTTTAYTLQVASAGGCQAKGEIIVQVYTPLSMPNAFTPNGDGRNDRLYVLGGPEGSVVHSFQIFNRWGARIFGMQDIPPGDANLGWDGNYGGHPAPPGTYVYMVVMRFPGGHQQVYKGTVELIR